MKYEDFEWKNGENSPALHVVEIAGKDPELYNKVSNYLYKLYGDKLPGAVLTSLVTTAILRDREGWFNDK